MECKQDLIQITAIYKCGEQKHVTSQKAINKLIQAERQENTSGSNRVTHAQESEWEQAH